MWRGVRTCVPGGGVGGCAYVCVSGRDVSVQGRGREGEEAFIATAGGCCAELQSPPTSGRVTQSWLVQGLSGSGPLVEGVERLGAVRAQGSQVRPFTLRGSWQVGNQVVSQEQMVLSAPPRGEQAGRLWADIQVYCSAALQCLYVMLMA